MFQKTKQLCRKAFGFVNGIPTKVMMFSFMLLSGMVAKAQNSAGDYSAGTSALSTVADEIAKYVPIIVVFSCGGSRIPLIRSALQRW